MAINQRFDLCGYISLMVEGVLISEDYINSFSSDSRQLLRRALKTSRQIKFPRELAKLHWLIKEVSREHYPFIITPGNGFY